MMMNSILIMYVDVISLHNINVHVYYILCFQNNNRRPMLKPSENQIKKEQYKNRRNSLVRKSIEKEVSLSQKHTVKVQSDILSQYLGPTNIMSKYQSIYNLYCI